MSSPSAPEFVICKNCGSEVSRFITECPYCGQRLRKRAPKLDREGRPAERPRRRRRPSRSLPPLRPGEIPGIRVYGRPWATGALVVASLVVLLLWRATVIEVDELIVLGSIGEDVWRPFTASFVYDNLGYAFVALLAVALFGWLLERRHGPISMLMVFVSGGALGMLAAASLESFATAAGGNAAALALLAAWSVRPLLELRRGEEPEADLLGVLVIALALLALPIAVDEANPIAAVTGGIVGLLLGVPLSRLRRD